MPAEGDNKQEKRTVERIYNFTLTGDTPLLMHADDIEAAEKVNKWRKSIENKKSGTAGDDRSPAWSWLSKVYTDGNNLVMPAECVMRCLMGAGAQVPTGRGQKTFKSLTQSGMFPVQPFFNFLSAGAPVPVKSYEHLWTEKDFDKHQKYAADHGFTLFVKRAKIGMAKHVRVRPRFDSWSVTGKMSVTDECITTEILTQFFKIAGRCFGLGDWRPGGRTPGSFGMFSATVEEA